MVNPINNEAQPSCFGAMGRGIKNGLKSIGRKLGCVSEPRQENQVPAAVVAAALPAVNNDHSPQNLNDRVAAAGDELANKILLDFKKFLEMSPTEQKNALKEFDKNIVKIVFKDYRNNYKDMEDSSDSSFDNNIWLKDSSFDNNIWLNRIIDVNFTDKDHFEIDKIIREYF